MSPLVYLLIALGGPPAMLAAFAALGRVDSRRIEREGGR